MTDWIMVVMRDTTEIHRRVCKSADSARAWAKGYQRPDGMFPVDGSLWYRIVDPIGSDHMHTLPSLSWRLRWFDGPRLMMQPTPPAGDERKNDAG